MRGIIPLRRGIAGGQQVGSRWAAGGQQVGSRWAAGGQQICSRQQVDSRGAAGKTSWAGEQQAQPRAINCRMNPQKATRLGVNEVVLIKKILVKGMLLKTWRFKNNSNFK